MKIGIDSMTIRELELNPYESIDFVKKNGFAGVQFGGFEELRTGGDIGKLKDIRAYADAQGMFVDVSIDHCNPVLAHLAEDEYRDAIAKQIRAYAQAGWHELRSIISFGDERYNHPVPWSDHLRKSTDFVKSLRPDLEACGSRINIENHGDSTFDILQVVEEAGPDICGVCLDTANTLVNAEHPVLAARRVAPYTHMTHIKDGILYFSDNGVSRQGKAPGEGVVDFEQILAILGHFNPGLHLAIEDHKWIFEFSIFNKDWIAKNPALTPFELGQFMKLACLTEKKLASGEIPAVEAYEAIPYMEQMDDRLTSGRRHLQDILGKLRLEA